MIDTYFIEVFNRFFSIVVINEVPDISELRLNSAEINIQYIFKKKISKTIL
jgi:hypothetical protein